MGHCLLSVQGELVFKVVSYTPYPVDEEVEGERIRLDVGPVGSCEPRTFVFEKLLPQPSELAVVTLDRPLGVPPLAPSRRSPASKIGLEGVVSRTSPT